MSSARAKARRQKRAAGYHRAASKKGRRPAVRALPAGTETDSGLVVAKSQLIVPGQ